MSYTASQARPAACCTPMRKARLLPLLAAAYDVWRQRRALARLDDAALDDIGLSARDAHAEAKRPAWDVPDHWLK